MKISYLFLIGLLILVFSGFSFAQDSLNHKNLFLSGLSINFGAGSYSVRDEYISKEKYSGTLPSFEVSWSHFHDTYGFRRRLEYRSSSEIKNYSISTNIVQLSLTSDYIYPAGKFKFLSKDIFTYLGPSTEIHFFSNQQNFIEGGIHINYSFVLLLSLGIKSEFIVPLKNGFQIENFIYLSFLSIGLRMPEIVKPKDETDEEESVFKLLTPFSGLNSTVDLGVRYYLYNSLSAKLAYKFHLMRISSWKPVLSASDNVIIGLTYHF